VLIVLKVMAQLLLSVFIKECFTLEKKLEKEKKNDFINYLVDSGFFSGLSGEVDYARR
jgi:hypothetical protein